MFKFNSKKSNRTAAIRIGACLALLIFVGLGCGVVKNPFRNYSERSFSSGDWLKGDRIERGRMYSDLFANHMVDGRSEQSVEELLGVPEKIDTIEGRKVWLYRVELRDPTPIKFFPVSFDPKKGAFAGEIRNGTISMLVEDE